MKLNLASCRITTVISCCLDKIATKLCHNASKWSLKWPVNIVEERRIIPEFKLEENWAKIIGLFVKILAAKDGGIISKLYILHLIKMTQDSAFQMSVSASSNGLEYFEGSLFWYSSKEFFAKMFFFDFIIACINIKQIWNASKFFIRIQMYCSARLKLVRCDGFYGRGVGFTRSCRADPAFSIRLYSRHFFVFFGPAFLMALFVFLLSFILSCSLFLRPMIDPSLYTLAADKTCCRRNFALSWHSNSIFNEFLRNFRFWLRNLLNGYFYQAL